ncbi:MAG: Fis family transcriptional regulator [Prochloron sp. SP5CPC1]|nr:Fis family transcriptional regulator [Candidatus Paraprochloron terpiosi SP5CPC1]
MQSVQEKPPQQSNSIPSATKTLHYLATGLMKWQEQDRKKRISIPPALRIGMSQMYLLSLVKGKKPVPHDLPEFLDLAKKPLGEWFPCKEIKYLNENATLIEDGDVSEFAQEWGVEGSNTKMEIEQKAVEEALKECREKQLHEPYRAFRRMIIEHPVISYSEYNTKLFKELRDLNKESLDKIYKDLNVLTAEEECHLCPRCGYYQRKRSDNSYRCYNDTCQELRVKQKLGEGKTIKAEGYKAVTPGVHRFVTLPGIWEIQLYEELKKLGAGITLWPNIDEYDLRVEFKSDVTWAIDVKDWCYLNEERLHKVQYIHDAKQTFVVFPDEREKDLRIKGRRRELHKELKEVRLKLMSEIIGEAQKNC